MLFVTQGGNPMKTRSSIALFLLSLFFAACAPDPSNIQTAIAATQAAIPTSTPLPPTATLLPTDTSTPIPTTIAPTTTSVIPTRTQSSSISAADAQKQLIDANVTFLKSLPYIKNVNTMRFVSGSLEVEVVLKYSTDKYVLSYSYEIITALSNMAVLSDNQLSRIAGNAAGSGFKIKLTVLNDSLDRRYQSVNSYDLLQKIQKSQVTYDEWVLASGAKFIQ